MPLLFKKYLEDNGFYKYCPEGSKNYVFVKVTNNLIDHTSEKEIKDFVLGTLYHYDCLLYTSPSPRDRTRSRMPSSA